LSAEIKERVRAFLAKNLYVPEPDAMLADGRSLFDSRILDSIGVLQVVSFLEEEFGLEIDPDDLVPANLESVEAIVAFVERRLRASEGTPPDRRARTG
jgi:acyl carrier protein